MKEVQVKYYACKRNMKTFDQFTSRTRSENGTTSSYVVSEGTTANNVVNQWSALHDHRLRVIGVEQSLADANFVRIPPTRTG